MRIYLAGPFRNVDERTRINRVHDVLRTQVWPGTAFAPEIYLPHKFLVLSPKASQEEQKKVFDENTMQILGATIMMAILDERDSGTVWEMGYAYGKRPVIGVYVDHTDKMSVMLSHGCHKIFNGIRMLEGYLSGLLDVGMDIPKETE